MRGLGGLQVDGRAIGIQGITFHSVNAGVSGQNNSDGPGVLGASTSGIGVRGSSSGYIGMLGQSTSGTGVNGVSSSGIAVLGQATSGYGVYGTTPQGTGVWGQSTHGYGVRGSSTNAPGVFGESTNSYGIWAQSGTFTALYGASSSGYGIYAESSSGRGLYAATASGDYAAVFQGNVYIGGSYTATGAKSAAVPHPDGTLRRMYCVESPESWFEDFGTDQLVNGRARVRLDPDFDALVRGDHYQVFLTPEGDCNGLYVSAKNPHTFEVRELKGGSGSLAFSYRVVAKRRDIPGPRLEKVDVPAAPARPAAPAAVAPAPTLPRLTPEQRAIPTVPPIPAAPPERPSPPRSDR